MNITTLQYIKFDGEWETVIHPFNISCQTHNFPYLTYKILNRLRASENTNNNIVRVRLCMYAYNSVTFFFGYKNHDHAQIHDQKMYESKAQIYFHSFKSMERATTIGEHSFIEIHLCG